MSTELKVWNGRGMTVVRMGNLIGLSRVSRGDKFNIHLGIAIAAMKMRPWDKICKRERRILEEYDSPIEVEGERKLFWFKGVIVINPYQVAELITAMLGYQHACHIMWTRKTFSVREDTGWAKKLRGHKVIPAGVLAEAAGSKLLKTWRGMGYNGRFN